MLVTLWILQPSLSSIFTQQERFLLSKSGSMLSDKETVPDMGNDSMYMSLLNVTPVDRLDSGRWGFP